MINSSHYFFGLLSGLYLYVFIRAMIFVIDPNDSESIKTYRKKALRWLAALIFVGSATFYSYTRLRGL